MRLIPYDYRWRDVVPDHHARTAAWVASYAARLTLSWHHAQGREAPAYLTNNPYAPDAARPAEWIRYIAWLRGWQAGSRGEARRLARRGLTMDAVA